MRALTIILILVSTLCFGNKADSLYELAQKEQNTFEKVGLLKKAYRIKKYNDLNIALQWNKEALVLAKANGVDSMIGYVLNDMGIIYGRLGEIDSTLYYYEKSLDIHLSNGSYTMAAVSNSNIGLVYTAKGEFSKALDSYSEAIRVFKENNAEKYLPGTYRSLGTLYLKYDLYEKAKENFILAKSKAISLDLKIEQALNHYNLGDLYQQTGECELSLEESIKANNLFIDLEQPLNIARSNRRIGKAYVCSNEYRQSLKYYDKALVYFEKSRKRNYYQILVSKANAYYHLKDYKNARRFALEGLNGLSNSILNSTNRRLAYYLLGECSIKLQDFENGLKYQAKYNELMQEANESRMEDAVLTRSKVLEREQDAENLKILEKEREIRKEELARLANRNDGLKRMGLGILLLLMIFSAVIFINRKGSKKAEVYGQDLLAVSTKLKDSLEEKESLLREIHHRVKNNLQLISSILSLEQGLGKNKTVDETIEDSAAKIKSMALIHELFYSDKDANEVNIATYCEKLSALIMDSYGNTENIKLVQKYDDINVPIDKVTTIGLVVNECLSNSIKYAFEENGEIELNISEKDGLVTIQIADNGKGLPVDFNISTVKSLGLKLIKRLTEKQLQGTYKIENNELRGVMNTITFAKT